MAICTNCGHEQGWHGADDPDGQPPRSGSHRTCCWMGHPGGCRCPKFTIDREPGAFDRANLEYASERDS